MRKSFAVIGTGLLGAGSLVFPSSAFATSNNCGDTPNGATLTETDGVCQVEFSNSGSFSFTPPSGASQLAAILTGAGGGALAYDATGYAGNGGEVRYIDLSEDSNSSFSISVGDGGTTGNPPTAGGDTELAFGSTTLYADGGDAGIVTSYCILNGSGSTYLGEGVGSGGNPEVGPNDECISAGPGLNPAIDEEDNFNNPVPTLFQSFNVELGKGGYLAAAPSTLSQGPGQGGSVEMDLANTVVDSSLDGSDGLVVFRWLPGTADETANELAKTGQNTSQSILVSSFSVALLSLGSFFLLFSTKRKKLN